LKRVAVASTATRWRWWSGWFSTRRPRKMSKLWSWTTGGTDQMWKIRTHCSRVSGP